MMKAYVRGVVAAAAVLGASSAFAGANLIQNGDFSVPTFGCGWGFVSNGFMGWTTNDPNGVMEIGNSGIYGLPCDNGGCQSQEIDANAFDTVSVDGVIVPPLDTSSTCPVRGSTSGSRWNAVYCDTTRTKIGRASWYSTLSRGIRVNVDCWPPTRRVKALAT